MNKLPTARDIANLIIVYANKIEGITLTPIKLQKILYYVYVECLVNHNFKLFDTPIEKWKFGPVVSSVYHNFKTHGVRHISDPTASFIFEENEHGLYYEEVPFSCTSLNISDEIKNVIRVQIEKLIRVDPFELVEKTHHEKPWKDFEERILSGERGLIYSDEELIEAFAGKDW